jgi:hypothetical protein
MSTIFTFLSHPEIFGGMENIPVISLKNTGFGCIKNPPVVYSSLFTNLGKIREFSLIQFPFSQATSHFPSNYFCEWWHAVPPPWEYSIYSSQDQQNALGDCQRRSTSGSGSANLSVPYGPSSPQRVSSLKITQLKVECFLVTLKEFYCKPDYLLRCLKAKGLSGEN